MTVELFNSYGGFSVGIPPVQVIDANGNVVTNVFTPGNVAANVFYANTYRYANGQSLTISAAGSNTQVQFNNNGSFGADPYFTYDNYSHLLSVPKLSVAYNTTLGDVSNVSIGGGNNGYFLQTDGAGNLSWAVGGGGGGNGNPGGANSQIQFNNSGYFDGASGFTFDTTTSTLAAPNANISNVHTSNATIANLTVTGNTTSTYYFGNAHYLAGIISDTAHTVTDNAQPNITSVGNLTTLVVTGNIVSGDQISGAGVQTSGNVNAGNVNVTGTSFVGGTLRATGLVNLIDSPSVNLGSISNLHISGGLNGYVMTTDGLGNLSWQVGGGGGGGNGEPGGSNTQIQYNLNGLFGASPYFTYDDYSKTVTIAGNLVANTLQLGSGVYEYCTSDVYFASTASTVPNQVLYSIPAANISGVEFNIIATDQSTLTRQSSKITSIVYNGQVQFNEYAGLQINGGIGSFEVDYNSGDIITPPAVQLKVSPNSSSSIIYKMLITVYAG
jgi:hypothetical protein